MGLDSLSKILQKRHRIFYTLFFIISLILIIFGESYLFIYDNIIAPKNQSAFIKKDVNSGVVDGDAEKVNTYLHGLVSSSSYKSAWISYVDSNDNLFTDNFLYYSKIIENKENNWYFSKSNNSYFNYFIVNYEFIGHDYEYKFNLAKRINFSRYLSLLFISIIFLLTMVFIYYYLNKKSIKFISDSFYNFINHCQKKNLNKIFKENYDHICSETFSLEIILDNLCESNIGLMKRNAELQLMARFSEQTQKVVHDNNQVINLLMRMQNRVIIESDVDKCKKNIVKFSEKITDVVNSLSKILRDISLLNRNITINKSKIPFFKEIYNPIIDSYKEYTNCKFIYKSKIEDIILVDKENFERVLNNIICNAFEAVKKEDNFEIFFEINNLGNIDEIIIRNTKSVILPEDIPKIFECNFTKGKKNGSGLGLASVEKIIKEHCGIVKCNSSVEEQFVEFIIQIPSN